MNKIQIFLDNVFASLPKTIEVIHKKEEIYASMCSQYEKYLLEGKNEAEAFGLVIQDFGSIEKLRYELNLTDYVYEETTSTSYANSSLLALGTCLMLAGTMGSGLLYSLFLDDWICLVTFFIGVLSGTSILLTQTIKHSHDDKTILVFAFSLLASGILGSFVLTEMWVDDLILAGYFLVYTGSGILLLIYQLVKHLRSSRRYKQVNLDKINDYIHPFVFILFFILGIFFDAWHPAWLLFIITPVILQIFDKKK